MAQKTPKKGPHKDPTPNEGSRQRMQQLPMRWVQPSLEEVQPPGGGSTADIRDWLP